MIVDDMVKHKVDTKRGGKHKCNLQEDQFERSTDFISTAGHHF